MALATHSLFAHALQTFTLPSGELEIPGRTLVALAGA